MTWLRTSLIALAGVLVAIGLSMLGQPARAARRAEDREIGYLAQGGKKAGQKAKIQAKKAEVHKEAAKVAAEKLPEILRGVKDEPIKELISSWSRH